MLTLCLSGFGDTSAFIVPDPAILADPERQRVLVQGVNMVRKNKKVDYQGARGAKEGGITNTEAPIHVSNVQLVDPDTKKPARAGFRYDDDGTKVRISRPGGKDF